MTLIILTILGGLAAFGILTWIVEWLSKVKTRRQQAIVSAIYVGFMLLALWIRGPR